jgi:CDGSH-type Zn-finger protein
MPDVLLTPYRDGPLLIRGRVRLVDGQGREIDHRRDPIALCRCGKSRLRPFCDGTHRLVGFRAPGAPELGRSYRIRDDGSVVVEVSDQGSVAFRPARKHV